MLYNICMGIYKFGNNIYPWRIRRRSNLGHIFREKSVSYGPGNTVYYGIFYSIRFTGRAKIYRIKIGWISYLLNGQSNIIKV